MHYNITEKPENCQGLFAQALRQRPVHLHIYTTAPATIDPETSTFLTARSLARRHPELLKVVYGKSWEEKNFESMLDSLDIKGARQIIYNAAESGLL